MKERKVYLQFETSYIDVSHLVKYDTLTITPRAFNDSYRYAQNECSFEVIYDDTVYPLYRYATKDILVKVEEVENGIITPLFLGHATYTKKRTYNGILDNTFFSIDATDDLDYMDIPVGDIFVKDYQVLNPSNPSQSIVHYLANIVGWGVGKISSAVTISTVIQCFAPSNPEDTVLDTLSDLLYEYGYVLNLDASGNIVPIKWNYTDVISTTNEFNDSNIMNEMRVSDSRDSYDSVQCTYYDIGFVDKVKLYHDSNCGYESDGSFTGYGVLPNKYYPPEANVIDDTTGALQVVEQEYTDDSIKYFTNKAIKENLDYNYKAFSSDFSAMIATEGHFADARTDAGITVTRTFGNKKCTLLYHNPTGGMLNIWYNNVFGSVWYRSTERTVSVDLVSEVVKQYKYKSKYIYSQVVADSFAKGIASQYEVGKTKYEFDSETEYSVGELVTVKTDDGTNQICIITERSWTEYSKTYTYKLLACGTDTGTIDLTKRTSSVKVNVQSVEPFNLELSAGQITIPNLASVPDFTNAFVYVGVKQGGKDYTGDWVLTATPTECSGYYLGNKYIITQTTKSVASVVLKATHPQWGVLTKTVTINNMAGASEIIPEDIVISSAIAKQDYIDITIDGTEPRYIYEISRNGGSTWAEYESTTKHFAHNFDRLIDGYPEKTALANYRIRAKAVNVYGNASLGYSPIASVDTSTYKTWIPPQPTLAVDATEAGLDYNLTIDTTTFYGSNVRFDFTVNGTMIYGDQQGKAGRIPFNRTTHGYPETTAERTFHGITAGTALDDYTISVKVKTAENSGTASVNVSPTVANYKTWIPRTPALSIAVGGRQANIVIQPTNDYYGRVENHIQIRRDNLSLSPPELLESDWFALGNSSLAYTDELSYKTGLADGFSVTPFDKYNQVLPLFGQTLELSQPTGYFYRVQAKQLDATADTIYTTDWTAETVGIAEGTGVKDYVAGSIKKNAIAFHEVDADRIALGTILAENINVTARNKINSWVYPDDDDYGWTFDATAEVVSSGTERALKMIAPDCDLLSDEFEILPNELVSFSFGLKAEDFVSGNGLSIGLTLGETYKTYAWNPATLAWSLTGTSTTNALFIADFKSNARENYSTYILGSGVKIDDVPAPVMPDGVDIKCIQLPVGQVKTRIRTAGTPTAGSTFYLYTPSALAIGASKVVAEQIEVKDLSAISGKLGVINGDTPDYKIVMGSGDTLEEGTFLLGSKGEDHIRREKLGGVWTLSIATTSFIVTSTASSVLGDFGVYKDKVGFEAGKSSAIMLMDIDETGTNHLLTVRSKSVFSAGNDTSLDVNSGYVLIGNPTGPHISIDNNEIMAKSNGTTASSLNLNVEGGGVIIGAGGLSVLGTITASGLITAPTLVGNVTGNLTGNVTGNASTATLATQANAIKPLGNAITLPATPTSVTKIIKIATVAWDYTGTFNIECGGAEIDEVVKVVINGGLATDSGARVVYGKNNTTYGIKKIVVTSDTSAWNSNRQIYAEIVTSANYPSTTTLGVVETNSGTFTPSMTEVSSVEGTVVDSLPLDYRRGDISSYQHVFTKSPTAPTPATATNNTQVATTAFVKNQKYEPNRGAGDNSLALGAGSTALGTASTALGYNAVASGYLSTALGDSSKASGTFSIALGTVAKAPRDYQITIGDKFVYLRFASGETEATVYTALSPWLNPTNGYHQGAMGNYGTASLTHIHRDNSSEIMLWSASTHGWAKTIRSGNPTQIGSDLAVCTVKY